MAQNGTEKALTGSQRQAAVLCAEDELSDELIAKEVGIGRTTLNRWRELPAFQDAVNERAADMERSTLRLAIARRNKRLEVLDDLHTKSLAVMAARSAQYDAIPGGSTGLLLGQLKQVKHVDTTQDDGTQIWTEEHWEYAVDVALMREMRAIQEQAAKELGQWIDRSELGAVMTSRVQLVGVDPGSI